MYWVIIAGLLASPAWAQQVPTGPEAGQTVPSFRAPDQHGRELTLSDIAGPKGAMLVFHRSADW